MKLTSKLDILQNILHGAIFVLFLYSAINKTMGFANFVNELDKSIFFGNLNTTAIGYSIVAMEYLIPVLLFFVSTSKLGYVLSFFLLTSFTVYIMLIFKFSPYLPCSCGGLIAALSWSQHLVFNVVFMAFSAFLALKNSTKVPEV
jgi:hypothetical protein